MVHNFKESLAFSHAAEDLPVWEVVYKDAFPSMVSMVSYRDDGFWQRQGIDRGILLETSKQIRVDEKVRGRNKITGKVYNDVAIEYQSSKEGKTPGWVNKPLLADYIAYLIAPLGVCHMLPVLQLQSAWVRHGNDWIAKYPKIEAKNEGYTTVSVGVPVDVLYPAIGGQLRVKFEPFEVSS